MPVANVIPNVAETRTILIRVICSLPSESLGGGGDVAMGEDTGPCLPLTIARREISRKLINKCLY